MNSSNVNERQDSSVKQENKQTESQNVNQEVNLSVDQNEVQSEEKSSVVTKKYYSGNGKHRNSIRRRHKTLNDSEFLKKRVEDQISYYNSKGTSNQKKYKKFKIVEIVISTSIPVIIGLSTMTLLTKVQIERNEDFTILVIMQIIAAIAGIVIVALNKLFEVESYYENWKKYRLTQMELESERMLYLTRSDPYDEKDAFPLFVNNVEAILNHEYQTWMKHTTKVKTDDLILRANQKLEEMWYRNMRKRQ